MKLFSGTSNITLATKIAEELKLKLGDCELARFANGENRVWIKENCKDEVVVILQNFSEPVDSNIMQFCLMVDAVKRMKPKKIVGVIPWLGNIFMFDDMILSGATLIKDIEFLKSHGAGDVYFFATHLDPTNSTFTNLRQTDAKKIVVMNSLAFDIAPELNDKIQKINVAKLIAYELQKHF